MVNNSLVANSNHFYFDYKNGKYGFNTDSNRGADTFVPFSSVDKGSFEASGVNSTETINLGYRPKEVICYSYYYADGAYGAYADIASWGRCGFWSKNNTKADTKITITDTGFTMTECAGTNYYIAIK